jgi:endonuclease-3
VPRPTLSKRAAEILEALARTYPDAHCELEFTNPLELLMATILSAQCTDVRVNQVTRRLFARCRTAEDYASIPQDELEDIVQPTGFFRAKARHLKQCAISLLQFHDAQVPRSLEALTGLPGVGRKTANVVLGDAFGTPEGVVVDTHVQRLSQRLGLSKHSAPEKIELDLMRLVPREHWARLSHWLIWHGRRRCDARKPDCAGCELAALCPSAGHNAPNIGRKAHTQSGANSPKKRSTKATERSPRVRHNAAR